MYVPGERIDTLKTIEHRGGGQASPCSRIPMSAVGRIRQQSLDPIRGAAPVEGNQLVPDLEGIRLRIENCPVDSVDQNPAIVNIDRKRKPCLVVDWQDE